jgi:hypothetical protein
MKKLIVVIIFFPLLTFCQDVVYSKGEKLNGSFWGYESGIVTLNMNGSNQFIYDADSVNIGKFKKSYRRTYDQMTDHGIIVSFSDSDYSPVVSDASHESNVDRFARQTGTGYALEAGGAALSIVGIVAAVPPISVVGGIVALVGWILKWDAVKYLKKDYSNAY